MFSLWLFLDLKHLEKSKLREFIFFHLRITFMSRRGARGNKRDVWYRVYFKSGKDTRKRLKEEKRTNRRRQTKIKKKTDCTHHRTNIYIYIYIYIYMYIWGKEISKWRTKMMSLEMSTMDVRKHPTHMTPRHDLYKI